MTKEEQPVQVKKITRGSKYRDGHGISRPWFYYECELCGNGPQWYLNEDAMKKASQDHKKSHEKDK